VATFLLKAQSRLKIFMKSKETGGEESSLRKIQKHFNRFISTHRENESSQHTQQQILGTTTTKQ